MSWRACPRCCTTCRWRPRFPTERSWSPCTIRSAEAMIPGEIIPAPGAAPLAANAGHPVRGLEVVNTGDRPVQVGSHFHFFEVNEALRFDRDKARGFRLNIIAGTAVRFESGQERTVELVELAGDRIVYGFNRKIMGKL